MYGKYVNPNQFQYSLFERAGDLIDPTQVTHVDERAHAKAWQKEKKEQGVPMQRPPAAEGPAEDSFGYQPGNRTANRAMWKSKLAQSKAQMEPAFEGERTPSLHSRIKARGVQQPVELMSPHSRRYLTSYPNEQQASDERPMLTEGHHRVAVVNDLDPDRLIPVKWDADIPPKNKYMSGRRIIPRSQEAQSE
jgi:hypothetical protein